MTPTPDENIATATPPPGFMSESFWGRATTDVNIRNAPNTTDSTVIGVVRCGEWVNIIGSVDNQTWYAKSLNEWVFGAYIERNDPNSVTCDTPIPTPTPVDGGDDPIQPDPTDENGNPINTPLPPPPPPPTGSVSVKCEYSGDGVRFIVNNDTNFEVTWTITRNSNIEAQGNVAPKDTNVVVRTSSFEQLRNDTWVLTATNGNGQEDSQAISASDCQ